MSWPHPDWLSDLLQTVRLSGAAFFVWEVGWPFVRPVADGSTFADVMTPRAQTMVSFHAVLSGTCFAATATSSPIALGPGDVLLVPQGHAYVMSDTPTPLPGRWDTAAAHDFFGQMAAGALPAVIRQGEGRTRTDVVCGFLGCDLWPFNPVLAALPPLLRIPATATGLLQPALDRAVAASRSSGPGARQALLRLGECLFIDILRCCSSEPRSDAQGWLTAFRHPDTSRALQLLHENPAHRWTLRELAACCHRPRSRLAEAFSQIVGLPPMQYLARWRVQLAARALVEGTATVEAVAREVGYGSPAAFRRAFKRITGCSPDEYRRAYAANG